MMTNNVRIIQEPKPKTCHPKIILMHIQPLPQLTQHSLNKTFNQIISSKMISIRRSTCGIKALSDTLSAEAPQELVQLKDEIKHQGGQKII